MTKQFITVEIPRHYKNHGEHIEQVVRYQYTGEIMKADNTDHTVAADVGVIQIKSTRGQFCQGCEIREYLKDDKAQWYLFVTNDDRTMYLMDRNEWIEFAENWHEVTTSSKKTKDHKKLIQWRISRSYAKMNAWLDERCD